MDPSDETMMPLEVGFICAAGQFEGDNVSRTIQIAVDLGCETAACRPSAWLFAPFCSGRRDSRANNGRIEHLNQVRRCAHGRQGFKKGLHTPALLSGSKRSQTEFHLL